MNTCHICKKNPSKYKDSTWTRLDGSTGSNYKCTDCNTKKVKKYRQSEQGKAAVLRAVRKYEAKNPQRRLAWNKAQSISNKSGCVICGSTKVHRHHPDVNRPLDVILLCPLHHKQHEMVH